MREKQIDYLFLDNSNTFTREDLLPLWEYPEQAEKWQLKFIYQHPENQFQAYELLP